MAAKVILQSEDAKTQEKVKRSAAECLVKRLLAVQLGQYLFRRVKVISARMRPIPAASLTRYKGKMPSHKTPGTRVEGPLTEKSTTGIFRILQANHLAREQRA